MSLINSDSFTIIGTESQTIQITLNKNEKININQKYLISTSSNELKEISFNKINFFRKINSKENSTSELTRLDNETIINLKNTKSNIEYLCLSKGGKIMILNQFFYNNLYIKLDSLLAFNNGIELYFDKKKNIIFDTFYFYNHMMNIDNLRRNIEINDTQSDIQFYLIKSKFKSKFENDNFSFLSSFIYNKNNSISDLLFISGKGPLFEKRLGLGESIVLNIYSLIAFEGSITFEILNQKDKYVNFKNHISVKGPGLIIFEPGQKINYIKNKGKNIVLIFSILSIIFNILIYFALLSD